jgi:hypothetical protein
MAKSKRHKADLNDMGIYGDSAREQEEGARFERIDCDQCVAAMINGVFCHETGCPNSRKVWDAESAEWVTPEREEE